MSSAMGGEPTDLQIQLPPDSTGKGVHLVQVTLTDINGAQFTAYQEVVTLADAEGNEIAVTNQGRPRLLVASPAQHSLLEDIIEELRVLRAVLIAGLRPDGMSDVL